MKKAIIAAMAAAALCAVSCIQNIDISRFISNINSGDSQAIEAALPSDIIIGIDEKHLLPDLSPEGVNPIAAHVYPALGGLTPTSSNEAIVRAYRRDDSSFYLEGVSTGQATVYINYMDYSKAISVIVERTLVNTITPPADYNGCVRDSIIFKYSTSPERASRNFITASSDYDGVRITAKGNDLLAYVTKEGTANITINANTVSAGFRITTERVLSDSIRFEVPVDSLAHHIEDYRFDIAPYVRHTLDATVYPSIPTDFYAKFYKDIARDTVVRHSSRPYLFHVGAYPLNTTDYLCNLEVINVHYIAEYDGEPGRDGTLVKVEEPLWYKYFTLTEMTGDNRFNEYKVSPRRRCIIRFKATAGALVKEFVLQFAMDMDDEPSEESTE